jgi:gliding motility-associated-like protein
MSPTNIYSSTGLQVDSFDVQLTVTTPAGCSDVATANNYIVVYPKPIPEFTYNPLSTTEFDPQVNFYNQSLYGATYEWNFGELISTTNSSTDENPLHIYSGPGYYNVLLEVTSPNGCYDTVSHVIYIEPEFAIYIPNAFSPNEDSKNEIFLPLGIGIDEERFHMYIFDRWGEIIFETNNYAKGWDGTAKGKSAFVQEDVYIYKVVVYDVKNNKHNLTGHVTVVR